MYDPYKEGTPMINGWRMGNCGTNLQRRNL